MPYEYRIDQQSSILWVTLSDPTSIEEIVTGLKRLIEDPDLYPGLQVLSDHRELDFIASPELARVLPPFFTQLGEKIGPHRAAVVVGNEAAFGMTRMVEMLSEDNPAEVRAFWDMEEARNWLFADKENEL